jgi:hypothetical protein
MRVDPHHESPDVIDRRGASPAGGASGLLWLVLLLVRSKFGWAGVAVLLVGVGVWWALGGGMGGQRAAEAPGGDDDPMKAFVSFVLDDAQDTFARSFAARGLTYRRAKLVLFTGSIDSACGLGEAATGPFYCPRDERVYIDLSFYRELNGRLGAPGDFAQAYVIAHEVGHHVQNLLGTSDKVHSARRADLKGPEGLSVRLELQADCYAGMWANGTQSRQLLESGDIDEALRAAAAIGDDRLQKRAQGTVQPETFTHGTSAQRSRWFKTGFERGRLDACDTFAADAP